MNDEVKNLIAELKQQKELDELQASRVIEFDHYFKYSGKQEIRFKSYKYNGHDYSRIVKSPTHYIPPLDYREIMKTNDMTKYKLKKDRKVW